MPAGLLARGEQSGEIEGGVGHPVAEMPAVELALGPIHGELEPAVAPHTEDHLRAARRMDRPVADEPQVGRELVGEVVHVVAQMGRPGLLLAFEQHDDLGGAVDAGSCERIDGGEYGCDGSLVVGGASRIDAAVAGVRLERRCVPGAGIDRLAIVVGVHSETPPGRTVRGDPTDHDRGHSGAADGASLEVTGAEALDDRIGVAGQGRDVTGDVVEREQVDERGEDIGLLFGSMAVDGGCDVHAAKVHVIAVRGGKYDPSDGADPRHRERCA